MEKNNNKIIAHKIFKNMVCMVGFVLSSAIIVFLNRKLNTENFIFSVKILSIIELMIGIILFEIAYNKNSWKVMLNGIETVLLAIHNLIFELLLKRVNISFEIYIYFLVGVSVLFYMLKNIIIYTDERRKYLNGLSDIHEILNNKPIKKEATKRKRN